MESFVYQVEAEARTPLSSSKKRRTDSEDEDMEDATQFFQMKRQRTQIFNSVENLKEAEVHLRSGIQKHFEEIGNLHVELGMKSAEVMTWKERALLEHQSIDPSDFTKGNEVFARLKQTLFPLESELFRLQETLRYHNEQIQKLKTELTSVQKEIADGRFSQRPQITEFPVSPGSVQSSPTAASVSSPTNPYSPYRDFSSIYFNSQNSTPSPGFSPQAEAVNSANQSMQFIAGVDKPPVWHADKDYDFCEICSKSFGLFVRRHHCRKCGRVICDECSKKRLPLPQFNMNEPVRICKDCEVIVVEYHMIMQRQQTLTQQLMDGSTYTSSGLSPGALERMHNDLGFGGALTSKKRKPNSPANGRRSRRN